MGVLTFDLAFFLLATFTAALVAGLAGFAFGLVAAAVWLHILTPAQTASLIIAFGLIVQGFAVWKLRRALQWSRLWPFLLGGLLGVPLGVAVLGFANPDYLRAGVGVLLIAYSIHGLARPAMKPVVAGARADAGVGLLNGILGGATGFAGIIVTIWCGLRGWPKDQQRTVFQPVGVSVFVMSALWLGASGAVGIDTLRLFAIGLPILLAGTWLGLKLYGRVDDAGFRKIVLTLLLVSGVALLFSLRQAAALAARAETLQQEPPYCSDLQRVTSLAMTRERFAAIAGKPRAGNFLETSLALTGWNNCALYGAATYTCDSPALGSAQDAEQAQGELLRQIKACLGEGWAEATERSSPNYVVLHNALRPVSITLSTDQTDDSRHVVHLNVFVRRNQVPQ